MTTPNIPSTPATAESTINPVVATVNTGVQAVAEQTAHLFGGTVKTGASVAEITSDAVADASETLPTVTRNIGYISGATIKSIYTCLQGFGKGLAA